MGRIALLTLLALSLTACSFNVPGIYKVDVRQGNYLDRDAIAQLQPGMSKRQVQFLLGTPLINDPFNQDRWDYIYAFRPRGEEPVEQRHLTLFFSGEVLDQIEDRGGISPEAQ